MNALIIWHFKNNFKEVVMDRPTKPYSEVKEMLGDASVMRHDKAGTNDTIKERSEIRKRRAIIQTIHKNKPKRHAHVGRYFRVSKATPIDV